MSIWIIKNGWQTQVMDQGRKYTRHWGIPASGVIDLFRYWWVNGLIGHTDFSGAGPPVLEIQAGPAVEIRFEDDHLFALTGSDGNFLLDGQKIESHRAIPAVRGQTLRISSIRPHGTVYLAISGKWQVDRLYGSASRDVLSPFPGTCGHSLEKQTRLEITPNSDLRFLGIESPDDIRPPQRNKHQMLRLLAGPELQLNDKIRPTLEEQEFIISRQSNRMAFRLECHTPSLTHEAEMLSVFVLPGTIQWPAGGQPILLLPNCQVTGGYPRVARVIDADLWKMAYCGPGDKLRFKWSTREEALYLHRYRMGQFTRIWNKTFPKPLTGHSLMY